METIRAIWLNMPVTAVGTHSQSICLPFRDKINSTLMMVTSVLACN